VEKTSVEGVVGSTRRIIPIHHMPQLPTLIPTNHGPIVMHMGMMPIIVLHFTQNYDKANHIRLIQVRANIWGRARRGKVQPIKVDAPPNSLKDSNVSMKVKQRKKKELGCVP
jgi:hypothetical protein